MEYRNVGRSGLQVSVAGLGCNNFGMRIDKEQTAVVVRQGKVRYIGCSNFAGWQVVDAQWTARTQHFLPLVSAQSEYNLLNRRIERELVPACREYGLGILPYFPLASGFLSGKYRPGE